MNVVDRRDNPKGKSLGNRQRFLERARAEVKGAVQDALRKRKVTETDGEKISIPTRGISEPVWHHDRRTGATDHVVPGNKEYVRGDDIQRPQGGGSGGGRGGSPDGSGEDSFEFTLTKDEFLDIFFEDLELPDLTKKTLKEMTAHELQRAGYTVSGSPANLSVPRTMRQSMARRISLKRPKLADLELLREEIEKAVARGDEEEAERLRVVLRKNEQRSKIIPYIDPLDVRYRRFERVPKPSTEAVMFCMMDVSGSMTEAMKDLAKRFFMLLHVFLIRRYQRVDVVFIRHTSTAEVVDEEKFFYSRETGGTVVSTAFSKMLEVIRNGSDTSGEKQGPYPPDHWNIFGAYCSDGDNYGSDTPICAGLLEQQVLPLCQYFPYIEVGDGSGGSLTGLSRDSDLWRGLEPVSQKNAHFVMRKVGDPSQIFSVFHELFAKGGVRA